MLIISNNWSIARKSLNFGITAFYTLLIFGLSESSRVGRDLASIIL